MKNKKSHDLKNIKILFFGRKNDFFSDEIYKILKKKFKYTKAYFCLNYKEKIKFKIKNFQFDYLLFFRNLIIIPNNILKKIKIGSINFHPGPPNYRGVGSLNYAIYNNDKFFAVTAHLMNQKIDTGPILDVFKFKISKNKDLLQNLNLTHKKSFIQCKKIIKMIELNKLNLNNLLKKKTYRWSGKLNRLTDLENFYQIKKNVSKKDLLKKIKSTSIKSYQPYIILHKKKFIYSDEN